MNSNLDPTAFAVAHATHEETNCGKECGQAGCICLEACIRAYICHIASTPADLRAVLAYDAGLAEGRRQGLEEAAKWADEKADERKKLVDMTPTPMAPARARDHRHAKAIYQDVTNAIRALIKEPTP